MEILNQYANLILAVITTVYVVLTWHMVSELRRAREAQSEAQPIASLIPIAPKYAQLRIQNAGQGPALDVEADMTLSWAEQSEKQSWRQSALMPTAYADFKLPTGVVDLDKLAEMKAKLSVDLSWSDVFRRRHTFQYRFDLLEQRDGWFAARWLVPPEDPTVQLGKIQEQLSKIASNLERHNLSS